MTDPTLVQIFWAFWQGLLYTNWGPIVAVGLVTFGLISFAMGKMGY